MIQVFSDVNPPQLYFRFVEYLFHFIIFVRLVNFETQITQISEAGPPLRVAGMTDYETVSMRPEPLYRRGC